MSAGQDWQTGLRNGTGYKRIYKEKNYTSYKCKEANNNDPNNVNYLAYKALKGKMQLSIKWCSVIGGFCLSINGKYGVWERIILRKLTMTYRLRYEIIVLCIISLN